MIVMIVVEAADPGSIAPAPSLVLVPIPVPLPNSIPLSGLTKSCSCWWSEAPAPAMQPQAPNQSEQSRLPAGLTELTG